MNKCVLILCTGDLSDELLRNFLKSEAHAHSIEGLVQTDESGRIKIVLCGRKERVDQFIDKIYDKSAHYNLKDIELEPFFKQKDFRGVFRIVE